MGDFVFLLYYEKVFPSHEGNDFICGWLYFPFILCRRFFLHMREIILCVGDHVFFLYYVEGFSFTWGKWFYMWEIIFSFYIIYTFFLRIRNINWEIMFSYTTRDFIFNPCTVWCLHFVNTLQGNIMSFRLWVLFRAFKYFKLLKFHVIFRFL